MMHELPDMPLIGGEVHYGRVQPRYWPAILDSAKSLGVEVIGTYVMWELHEQREGVYDFSQLHAFLAEVEQRGMKVLARPGPFFYAEWRNLGIPDHAVPFHKGHPEFRRKAAAWIAAAMHELRPYLGKLIIVVQADNEIDPMPHFYGEDQGFADWLRRKYERIEALNEAWGSKYVSFDEPIPWLAAQLAPAALPQSKIQN
jgi:beta-galactosidase